MRVCMICLIGCLGIVLMVGGSQAVQRGDFDGDGEIGFQDFVLFSKALGSSDSAFDLDGNGKVDAADFSVFRRVFGDAGLPALKTAPGKQGLADLTVRQQGTGSATPIVQVGDTLAVELFVEANGEEMTQVDLLLSFNDAYLEVIPVFVQDETTIWPFEQAEWLQGQVIVNDTVGDLIGNSNRNQIPMFQMHYGESIARGIDGTQRIVTDSGVAARFRLKVIEKPSSGTTAVRVDLISPIGSETGYFINGDPGSIYNFSTITDMTVQVEEEPAQPLTKQQVMVMATVTRDGIPAVGLDVMFSRSISGLTSDFRWRGTTGLKGQVSIEVVAGGRRTNADGYYRARVIDPVTDNIVGEWNSLPLRGGRLHHLLLPVGGRARVEF